VTFPAAARGVSDLGVSDLDLCLSAGGAAYFSPARKRWVRGIKRGAPEVRHVSHPYAQSVGVRACCEQGRDLLFLCFGLGCHPFSSLVTSSGYTAGENIPSGRKVFLYCLTGLVLSHSVWGFSEQGELPVCPCPPGPPSCFEKTGDRPGRSPVSTRRKIGERSVCP
jgi:hypothetical protein